MQWGTTSVKDRNVTITFPKAFSTIYNVIGVPKTSGNLTGSQSNFGIQSQSTTKFVSSMYDTGNGYNGFNWYAIGLS